MMENVEKCRARSVFARILFWFIDFALNGSHRHKGCYLVAGKQSEGEKHFECRVFPLCQSARKCFINKYRFLSFAPPLSSIVSRRWEIKTETGGGCVGIVRKQAAAAAAADFPSRCL